MKKRISALITALILTLTLFPLHSSAAGDGFAVQGNKIVGAVVTDIALPEPSTRLSEYVHTTTRPEQYKNYYSVSTKDCYWATESRNELPATDTISFAPGAIYYYTVVLKANGDYVFAQDVKLKITGGNVDPGVQTKVVNAGKEITFVCAYKIICGVGHVQNISNLSLTRENFYYDGKVHKPSATQINVTDENGNPIKGSSYSVSYSTTSPTEVGIYTVTVTGKEPSTGTASAKFKVNPAAPRNLKVSGSASSMNISWSEPISGKPDYYEIFVYSDKACKELATSAKVEGEELTKTIIGLKKDKTYYVNIDCYVIRDSEYLISEKTAAVEVKQSSTPTPTPAKKTNTLTVSGKTATVKYSKLKKAKQTLAVSKVLSVSGAKGSVTYVKSTGTKNITIAKSTGKVTVKKGLKKGTYSVKVKVTAAGNSDYKSGTKNATFKIKVK